MTSSGIQLVELIFTLSAQAYLKSASYFYFFLICICWFGPLEAESQMVDHLTIETWRVFSSASFFSGFFVFILSFLDAFFFFHPIPIVFPSFSLSSSLRLSSPYSEIHQLNCLTFYPAPPHCHCGNSLDNHLPFEVTKRRSSPDESSYESPA